MPRCVISAPLDLFPLYPTTVALTQLLFLSVGPVAPPPVSMAHRRAILPSALGVRMMVDRTWHMAASLLLSVRVVNAVASSCL